MQSPNTMSNYCSFLKERYDTLKLTKPAFSARFFAKKAGISSFSYFRMVTSGQRKLSPLYAQKFAKGLSLSNTETKYLLKMVELEHNADQVTRQKILRDLAAFKRRFAPEELLISNHVEILSDLSNLKIYLLSQSTTFQNKPQWIHRKLKGTLPLSEVENRIKKLVTSGLWKNENGKVQALAPVVRTGDSLNEIHLAQTHSNILDAAKASIKTQSASQRVLGARTFLFDKKRIKEVAARIEEFKADLESEFEDLNSEDVYELQLSFFEL